MKLKNAKFAKDMRPLDEGCSCLVCKQYTRSYLHHAIKAQGMAAPAILITYHNVAYMQVCTTTPCRNTVALTRLCSASSLQSCNFCYPSNAA